MKKGLIFLVTLLICGSFSIQFNLKAEDKGANESEYKQLIGVNVEEISNEEADVIISLNGPVNYHCFKITKPLRLVVEITNTLHNWPKKELELENNLIKRIRSAQFQNDPIKISRVVMDLKEGVSYSDAIDKSTNQIIITLTKGKKAADKAASFSSSKRESEPKPKKVVKKNTSGSDKKSKPKEAAKSSVGKDQQFGTEISKQIISVDFDEADIRDVLRILSIKSGVNIVYGDDVKGDVTIHLENVPFDDAMAMILKIRGFVINRISDNIFRVVSPEELAKERSKAVTFTKIFDLNYSTVGELKAELDSMKPAGAQTVIGVDERTNKLIVTATPEMLNDIAKLIKELDVKPQQVLIEAKILKIRRTDIGGVGVDWAFTKTLESTGGRSSVIGEAVAPGKSVLQSGSVVDLSGQPVTATTGKGTGFTAPHLGGGVVTFGTLANDMAVNLALSALVDKGKTRLLASPKVATLNNKEARILIGQRVPFITTRVDTTGVATQVTEFIEVGTRLVVTPTINVDGRITLKIKPEKSSVDSWQTAGPVISTQEVETTVLVKDGETIVIAGLIDDTDIEQNTQVPIFGDIPLIGYFFKKKTWNKERDELLLFLTPRIMSE